MAERPRHEPINVGPDGNITTEGSYESATGKVCAFRVVNGAISVQKDGRNWFAPTTMDRQSIQKLLGADTRLEGDLLKGTPPAAPQEDPALAAATRATRTRTARAARVDSPEDSAFDGRMAAAKAQLEAMAARLTELATAPQPPLSGRAETTAMEAARARAQGIVDGRLTAARNDVGQGAAEDLSNAEQAQTALAGHQARIQALLTELETQQDPAEQTRIRDAAARELEAAELAMQRASEASLRASTRENNTPEGFVADTLRQEADALQTRYDEAVRRRDSLAADHADFVRRMQRLPGAVTTMIGRVDAVSREAKAARTPALRAERKSGPAADAAISAERLARERAEQTVDGYRQFIEGNEPFLSSGTALKAELTQAEATVMALRQELETAQRAAQLAQGPARRAGRPSASPSSVAPRIATIEVDMQPTLEAARQGMRDLETRLGELQQSADETRTQAARDLAERARNRGLGARVARVGSGILGTVLGAVPAAVGALNARSERKNANARSIELDERFELRKTIRGLRAEDPARTDADIRDILNRIDHSRIRPETWTQAVDYAFEEENTRRGRIEGVRNAGATAAHHGRRLGRGAVAVGAIGVGAARAGWGRLMNYLETRDMRNTLVEVMVPRLLAHETRDHIAHEAAHHYHGVDEALIHEALDEASRTGMNRELERIEDSDADPDKPLKHYKAAQHRARFIQMGLLPHDLPEATRLFNSIYKWRRVKEMAGGVRDFLIGKKGSARRGLTIGVPLALAGVGAAGGLLVANEVVEAGIGIVKGVGRTAREGGKAAYRTPETVKETFTGRMKQAMGIWGTKTLPKEEIKEKDKFAVRWGKRFRNLGRSIVNPGIYVGSKIATPFAMLAAGVLSPFEGLGRAALGVNPVGKHDTLEKIDDDHYKHATRGGLLGVWHELFYTAGKEKDAMVEAAQIGPFTGMFKKRTGQGWFGQLLPDAFTLDNILALGTALQGAHYLGNLGKFLRGKMMDGVTAPAPAAAPAARAAAAPAAGGGDHDHGHDHEEPAAPAAPAAGGDGHDHGHGH